MEHTPTPWKSTNTAHIPKDGLCYCIVHEDSTDKSISPCKALGTDSQKALDNAAFIVLAVNAHDELVNALKCLLVHGIDGETTTKANKALAKAGWGK